MTKLSAPALDILIDDVLDKALSENYRLYKRARTKIAKYIRDAMRYRYIVNKIKLDQQLMDEHPIEPLPPVLTKKDWVKIRKARNGAIPRT
jgi:hypothetical protein